MHSPHTPTFWKEGGQGAVSLVYLGLEPPAWDWVLAHHAAVGIRASLVCREADARLSLPVSRNWDLMADGRLPASADALKRLDGRGTRGYFAEAPPEGPPPLFCLSTREGLLPGPMPDLQVPLPSYPAPEALALLQQQIESVVVQGKWLILRFDEGTLSRLGAESHRKLLQGLGDHHARIWCAPVRDIALFRWEGAVPD